MDAAQITCGLTRGGVGVSDEAWTEGLRLAQARSLALSPTHFSAYLPEIRIFDIGRNSELECVALCTVSTKWCLEI